MYKRQQLRQSAEQRNFDQAKALLTADPASVGLVSALVMTLSSQPQVSIFQTLKHVDTGAVLKRDFTLVQDATTLWLIAPTAADATMLFARPTTRSEVRVLLLELI